jgi:Zn-dependent protease with chaperone function
VLARLGEALLAWAPSITLATGAILVAALLADRLLERRVSASLRLWLYAAVLARLALPAAWQNPLGLLGSPSGTVVPGELDLSTVTVVALEPAPASLGAGWAALAYLVIATALLGRWLHARLTLRRRLQGAVALDLVVDGVPVLRHPDLGPLVAGLWRPRIVVPAALAEPAQREALGWVLRHERAHVQRRDPLIGAVVQLACIAAWPILPVWIAVLRIRTLMEVACDERAVSGADRAGRRRYGELLLSLAESPPGHRTLAPVLSFGSPLKGRLRALAARRRWPVLVQALVVSVLGAVVFACAAEPSPDEVETPADAQPDLAGDVAPAGKSSSASSAGPARAVRRPPLAAADGSFAPLVDIDYKGTIVTYPFELLPSDPPPPSVGTGAIKEALAPHQDEIRACYEEHLQQSRADGGRMVFKWTVQPTGVVSGVRVSGDDVATGLGACVARVIHRVRFAPLEGIKGPLLVEFPFVFQGR